VNFFSHFLWLCNNRSEYTSLGGDIWCCGPSNRRRLSKEWQLIELQTRKIISYSVPHSTTCELCPLCQPYCLQSESSNCPLIPGHLISHLKVNPLVELKECKIPTRWDYNIWIMRIWVTIISIADEVSWESLALWGMYPTFYKNNQLNYGHTSSRTVISSRQDKSARFSVRKETRRQAQHDIHNEISDCVALQKVESVFNCMLLNIYYDAKKSGSRV